MYFYTIGTIHMLCSTRHNTSRLLPLLLWALFFSANAHSGTTRSPAPTPQEWDFFLRAAHAAQRAYDDEPAGLEQTPAGCIARVSTDAAGTLTIAFRGSLLTDRTKKGRFSTFGGATWRRNYRDWAATNLKQTAGFLPRQYLEAAELVRDIMLAQPAGTNLILTGHSKGGGAALYAAASVCIEPEVRAHIGSLRVITFNGAVIHPRNWRRLYRLHAIEPDAAHNAIQQNAHYYSLVMRDDPVSKIGGEERADFENVIVLAPAPDDVPALQQHGIDAVIDALHRQIGNTMQ